MRLPAAPLHQAAIRVTCAALALVFFQFLAPSASALPVLSRLDGIDVSSLRRDIPIGATKEVNVPLVNGARTTVTLERFDVFAPDARIIEHTSSGDIDFPIPKTRFYRGTVNGDRESMAFLAVGDSGISGLIITQSHVFNIEPDMDLKVIGIDGVRVHEIDPELDLPSNVKPFTCDLDHLVVKSPANEAIKALSSPIQALSVSPTLTYMAKLSIEIDDELFSTFGNNSTTAGNYVAQLVGAANVIYQRDLKTNLSVGTVHTYPPGTSPWTVQAGAGTGAALNQLGTYYHGNRSSESRSSVVLLSGKAFGGGRAWIATVCTPDFFCGNDGSDCGDPSAAGAWAGGYAFVGSVTGTVNTNNPNLGTFWDVYAFSHELGHNFGSEHTHCISLSPTDTATYGRSFVDLCYSGECYSGSTSVPTEKGTIMSYCQLLAGSYNNLRLIFGQTGEASYVVAPIMIADVAGVTPTLGAITAPASVNGGSTGNTASIPTPHAGTSMLWTITGGTITAGATTRTVTFTAGASGSVALTIALTDSNGCGQTDSKSVSIVPSISAPTNVVATALTATAVTISWTASAGATKYHVYRSADNSTYVQVNGETTTTTSFTDTGAVHALISNASYLYRVRAVDGSNVESADSNKDLATTIIFTDATLTQQSTTIKVVHITQLRTAMTAICTLASNPSPCSTAFTDSSLSTSIKVKVLHLMELRAKLNASRSALGLTAQSYAEGSITTATTIKAAQINELRDGVR